MATQRKASFFEKGDKPLEIVASRQWYLCNGGRDGDLREQLLARGREVAWVPEYMKHRYADWVGGLNGDWLVSRQRFFGVPFPVWYPLDADGEPRYEDHPIDWKPANGWFDAADVRQAAYWAVLAGAAGHTYGDHNLWQMWQPGRAPVSSARTPWPARPSRTDSIRSRLELRLVVSKATRRSSH